MMAGHVAGGGRARWGKNTPANSLVDEGSKGTAFYGALHDAPACAGGQRGVKWGGCVAYCRDPHSGAR
jgi:hypothetical protein